MMQVFYEKDADMPLIAGKKVAIIGYGSQGHAHANNLRDSGVSVTVGLRPNSASAAKAEGADLVVQSLEDAAAGADFIMFLAPDENQRDIYQQIIPHIAKHATLAFAHGFNIHFQRIVPRADLDVVMIAPKGPGHLVRSTYSEGGGVPCLIAVAQDVSGHARDTALAYAAAIGGARAGVIATTFREETETDLFGEQAVLCGGVTALVEAAYDTLTKAGYAEEMAYFECMHELKLIVDLLYEGGIANMRYSISNTAEYGDLTRGPRIIDAAVRQRMEEILREIQDGRFAREFVEENQSGALRLKAMRRNSAAHSIEKVGQRLRAMMPWIEKRRIVDKTRN